MAPERDVARRLSALLVADLVGYTERMGADEMATYRHVKEDLAGLFAPKIQAHRGRVVKTTGDGVLAEFASVVDCAECAMDIQTAIAAGQADPGRSPRYSYRIAINVGEIIIDRSDIYGDCVNLAMRLQAIGEPGGIIVSHDAYRQLRGKLDIAFEDLGEQTVKGVKEPVRAHRIVIGTAAPAANDSAQAAAKPPLPGVLSIAVLAFENLSGDPERRYFSDGIANDIVTDLSKFAELLVLGSHSETIGKPRANGDREISRRLGVRYLLKGSVQSGADRVRINVQLVAGDSGRTLWAEHYDRPLGEIFMLRDEIVQTIVGTLVYRLYHSENERLLRSKPDNLEAYDAYLRGRAAFAVWTKESNLKAQAFFKRAIELDPAFSFAYSYLSYTMVQSWLGGWESSPQTLDRALELAKKAVELGPGESGSYWTLAAAHLAHREFDRAEAAYERAVELNPNDPNLQVDWAEALVYVGRAGEAIAKIRRAMQLNPMYPDWYLWTLGIAYYHANEFEQSVAALTRGSPPNLARRHLAASYVRLGRLSEARRTMAEFLKHDPGYSLSREKAWPYKDAKTHEALMADLRAAGLHGDSEMANFSEEANHE
jgi:adenylate cyclase